MYSQVDAKRTGRVICPKSGVLTLRGWAGGTALAGELSCTLLDHFDICYLCLMGGSATIARNTAQVVTPLPMRRAGRDFVS